MAVVGLNAIAQMFFIPAYPFWSLIIIAVDVVVLWGLCTYGSPADPGRMTQTAIAQVRPVLPLA